MPKTYSDTERDYIKKRLIEEAQSCLTHYGLRKTTVDEIVRRVNIPKGTFYLFYESKELLVFDVLNEYHDKIQQELGQRLSAVRQSVTAEAMSRIIFDMYKEVEASFLFKFITGGDLELLLRKLPPELSLSHAQKDDLNVEQLVSMIPGITQERIKALSGALRAIFMSMLHRNEIGEDIFEEALYLMIRGVISQIFEEAEK